MIAPPVKEKAALSGLFLGGKNFLYRNYVLCLWSFLASCDCELDFLTIRKGFEAVTLNSTEVNEHVGSAFLLNETETFGFVEPFNGCLLYTSDAADE